MLDKLYIAFHFGHRQPSFSFDGLLYLGGRVISWDSGGELLSTGAQGPLNFRSLIRAIRANQIISDSLHENAYIGICQGASSLGVYSPLDAGSASILLQDFEVVFRTVRRQAE